MLLLISFSHLKNHCYVNFLSYGMKMKNYMTALKKKVCNCCFRNSFVSVYRLMFRDVQVVNMILESYSLMSLHYGLYYTKALSSLCWNTSECMSCRCSGDSLSWWLLQTVGL